MQKNLSTERLKSLQDALLGRLDYCISQVGENSGNELAKDFPKVLILKVDALVSSSCAESR